MTESTQVGALTKTAVLPCTVQRAFELFTDEMAQWWPLASLSVGMSEANGLTVDGREGGQIVETVAGGATHVWGTITTWRPPERLVFTWHPGRPPEEATEVDVTFEPAADGARVTLVHRGWSARPDAAEARANYDPGWDFVLGRLAEAASHA